MIALTSMPAGPSFTIRPAVIGDAEAIGELAREFAAHLQSLGGDAGYFLTPARIRADGFGIAPAFAGIVAEQDGALLGYLLHHPGYATDLAQRYLVVCDLFVREAGRRRGVGRALMSAAKAHCLTVGGSGLFWSVMKANKSALAFYGKLGAEMAKGSEFLWLPAA
jgi:GNAT superfamily N-acetyltransferase